ncbi:hypothetical protein RB195_013686 [Necator americanus]|uniref:Uncharacterized protein n=1 Tax=Necator americanus TaxID=51031 RepID=A0ABR1DWR9_NECAM
MRLLILRCEYVLALLTSSFIQTQAQERSIPGRRFYKSDHLPTYSRHTPYQEEDQFPQPVFGIAHGQPYNDVKKDHEKEPTRPYVRQKHIRDDSSNHDETDNEANFPPEFAGDIKRNMEGLIPRKHRNKMKQLSSLVKPEYPDASGSAEAAATPPEVLPEWGEDSKDSGSLVLPGDEEHQTTPQRRYHSDEEQPHRRKRPKQTTSSEETNYKMVYQRPREQRPRHPYSPNERETSEHGDGSDFKHTAGKHYEDSGEMSRNKQSSEERPKSRHRTRAGRPREQKVHGKIVGVDMQMIAGMYSPQSSAQNHKRRFVGRFSPLSGPYPGRGDDEKPRNSHTGQKYENEYESREETSPKLNRSLGKKHKKKKHKDRREESTENAGTVYPSVRHVHYGPFDAYFLRQKPKEEQVSEENSGRIPMDSQQTPAKFNELESRRTSALNNPSSMAHGQHPVHDGIHEKGPRDNVEERSGNKSSMEDEGRSSESVKPRATTPLHPAEDNTTKDRNKYESTDEVGRENKEESLEEKKAEEPPRDLSVDGEGHDHQRIVDQRRPLAYENEKEGERTTSRPHRCSYCILKDATEEPQIDEVTIASHSEPSPEFHMHSSSLAPSSSSNFRDLWQNDSVGSGNGTRPRDHTPSLATTVTSPTSTIPSIPDSSTSPFSSSSISINRTKYNE